MDLKNFVAESLSQIIDGIKEAQSRPGGDNVAAQGYIGSQGNLIAGGRSGFFTMVDFDVLVAAETKEGGGSIKVASIESSDGNSRSAQNASRVKFSVHLRLPPGAALPQQENTHNRAETSYRPDDGY